MGVINLNCFSPALRQRTEISVFIPTPRAWEIEAHNDDYFHDDCKFQVLYLLHGTYGDHAEWLRSSCVERYAQTRRLALVMPSGDNAFYLNMADGRQYEDFLLDELPSYMRRLFPISAARKDNFIAGLSMGGYGAMRLGLARPAQFAAIASLSGVIRPSLHLRRGTPTLRTPWPYASIFGDVAEDAIDASEFNLLVRLRHLAESGVELPALFWTVGSEDSIVLEENRAAQVCLSKMKLNYCYEEHPGGHDWPFWDQQIQRAMDWMPLKRDSVR